MDRSYRTVTWTVGLVGAAVLVWLLAGPQPGPRPHHPPLPVRPLPPSVGPVGDKQLDELLDEVERAEEERLGADEAARRRARRESLLPKRFDPDPTRPSDE